MNSERGGALVGGGGVKVAQTTHPCTGLACPFEVCGLDRLCRGDQLGYLVFGAAGETPCANVEFGGRLDAVFNPADASEVLSSRIRYRLGCEPGGPYGVDVAARRVPFAPGRPSYSGR